MNCQDCGCRMDVDKVIPLDGQTILRIHTCACGSRFKSEQTITGRLPAVTGSHRRTPVATGSHPCSPVDTREHPRPPVAVEPPASVRGVGGVLPSGSDLPPDSGPISTPPDQTPARRKRRTTVEYDPVFDAQWNMTAKTGSKDLAQQWWMENGKPPFGESWQRWEACAEWKQDWYNFPHVVKWLRDGRYKQTPDARVKTASAQSPVLPFAKRVEDEAQARHRDARAKSLFGG